MFTVQEDMQRLRLWGSSNACVRLWVRVCAGSAVVMPFRCDDAAAECSSQRYTRVCLCAKDLGDGDGLF